jgi:hypothetical protein
MRENKDVRHDPFRRKRIVLSSHMLRRAVVDKRKGRPAAGLENLVMRIVL